MAAPIHHLYFDTYTGRTAHLDVDFSGSLSNVISDILTAIGRSGSIAEFTLEFQGTPIPTLAHLLDRVESEDAGRTMLDQIKLVRV